MKQITKGNGKPSPKRKILSVLYIEVKGLKPLLQNYTGLPVLLIQ